MFGVKVVVLCNEKEGWRRFIEERRDEGAANFLFPECDQL